MYDEGGNPTGQTVERIEIHKRGLWHKTVHLWIINSQGEVLIQKRSAKKVNSPNKWDISTAGHVSTGEVSIQSAIKETKEELGLEIPEKDFRLLGVVKTSATLNDRTYFNNEISEVFLVNRDFDPQKLTLQSEEVAEVKFIDPKELKQKITNQDPSFVTHPEEYKLLFDYLKIS